MRHHYLLSILGLGIPFGFFGMMDAAEKPNTEHVAGLVATYANHPTGDKVQNISQVVALPEFGLSADESPHPAISPAFSAEFLGKLMIQQPGKYKFDYKGSVTIDGKLVKETIALDAGYHDLALSYQRTAGNVAVGFYWQSEQFIKEPVPPGVLWHDKKQAVSNNPKGTHSSPRFRIARTIKQMNCASCHESDFLTTITLHDKNLST